MSPATPPDLHPRVPWSAVLPLLLLAILGLVLAIELTLLATIAGGLGQVGAFTLATVALIAVLVLLARVRALGRREDDSGSRR